MANRLPVLVELAQKFLTLRNSHYASLNTPENPIHPTSHYNVFFNALRENKITLFLEPNNQKNGYASDTHARVLIAPITALELGWYDCTIQDFFFQKDSQNLIFQVKPITKLSMENLPDIHSAPLVTASPKLTHQIRLLNLHADLANVLIDAK